MEVAVIQAETGRPPTKRLRRETVQLQTRLASLCEDLNNGQIQIGQFLVRAPCPPVNGVTNRTHDGVKSLLNMHKKITSLC